MQTSERHELDFYPSPYWFASTLTQFILIQGTVLEPAAGRDKMIADVLKEHPKITKIITNDINQKYNCDYHLDLSLPLNWTLIPEVDWVISNPPFDNAFNITSLALEKAKIGIAMAVKITWMEAARDRADWLKQHKPSYQIVMPRFAFKWIIDKKRWQTDNTTICWFVWLKNQEYTGTWMEFLTPDDIFGYYQNPDKQLPVELYQERVKVSSK